MKKPFSPQKPPKTSACRGRMPCNLSIAYKIARARAPSCSWCSEYAWCKQICYWERCCFTNLLARQNLLQLERYLECFVPVPVTLSLLFLVGFLLQVKGKDVPGGAVAAAVATFLDNLAIVGAAQGTSASRARSRTAVIPSHVQVNLCSL